MAGQIEAPLSGVEDAALFWRNLERQIMRDGSSRSRARQIIREIKEDEEKWKSGIAHENREA